MSPTFGGKPVTHEEYLHLDAANRRTASPSEASITHARHLDAGCVVCEDDHDHFDRLQAERDKLEELRRNYAVGLLTITQEAERWADADKRVAAGLEAVDTPDIAERLRLVLAAVGTISRRGQRDWKR